MMIPRIAIGLMLLALLGIGTPVAYGQKGGETSDARLDKGKQIFDKYCVTCHGD